MTLESIIILIAIGAAAGWLAGQLIKGFGFGLIGNIIVGVIGAAIASYLLPMIGVSIATGILGSIIHATLGAVLLLLAIKFVKRA